MSQIEVGDFLQKHKGQKFTVRQIAEHLHCSLGSVNSNIKRMRKTHVVNHAKVPIGLPGKKHSSRVRQINVYWHKKTY